MARRNLAAASASAVEAADADPVYVADADVSGGGDSSNGRGSGDEGCQGTERMMKMLPGDIRVSWYYHDAPDDDLTAAAPAAAVDDMDAVNEVGWRGAVGGVEVVLMSEYGLEKHRKYHSPASLADTIVQALPSHALSRLVADIRVEESSTSPPPPPPSPPNPAPSPLVARSQGSDGDGGGGGGGGGKFSLDGGRHLSASQPISGGGGGGSSGGGGSKRAPGKRVTQQTQASSAGRATGGGVLLIMTARHLLALSARGMLLCRSCGWMFAGEKGLREHQQVKHRRTYEGAKAAVAESRMALVALAADGGEGGCAGVHCVQPVSAREEAEGRGGMGAGSGSGGAHCDRLLSVDEASAAAHTLPVVYPHTPAATVAAPAAVVAYTRPRSRSAAAAGAPPCGDALDAGMAAARDGDLDALRAAVAGGWDPAQHMDRHGSSALHWAAGSGRLDACRFLVEECGMNAKGEQPRDGRSAMHWGARNGRTAVCQWLRTQHGIDVNSPTRDGTTPFHWAVWQGHLDTCRWLVDAGADWSTLNSFGCNAVQWSAQAGDVATCQYLRDLGLDLTLLNNNGHSALHKAAMKGRKEACEWLVCVAGLSLPHMVRN
jgi:hypothetical protein